MMRSGDGLEVLMSVWSQNSVFCGRCVKREIDKVGRKLKSSASTVAESVTPKSVM